MIDVRWFDGLGLLLVLLSSFFKIFLSDDLANLEQAHIQARLDDKLDYLFMVLVHQHRRSHPEDTKVLASALNLDGIESSWQRIGAGVAQTARQAGAFRQLETYVFLLGSLLLFGATVLPLLWPEWFSSGLLETRTQ